MKKSPPDKRLSLSQRIQISRNVDCILMRDAQVRHHCVFIHPGGFSIQRTMFGGVFCNTPAT